ncbi:pectate lyase [soil metagenome]
MSLRGHCLAALLLVAASVPGQAEWPTDGGDAGDVIHVTTLADSGPGSLRAALASGGRRKVVFDIGGEIFVKSPLVIYNGHLTVAGDTAPTPGITILGDKVQVRASDVILRHVRVRVGELPGSGASARDGISIDLGPKKAPVANITIDHCSVAWGIDEGIGIWGEGVSKVLVTHSIIAETLRASIHPKERHSMGMLVGKGARNIVIADNLFVSNQYRNPVIDAGVSAAVVNNLIYNPGINGFHIYGKPEAGPTDVSVVGNLLIAGPDTHAFLRSFDHGVNPGSRIYFHDNLAIGTKAFVTAERAGKVPTDLVPFVDAPPVWFDWLKPVPADSLEATLPAEVGARPTDRDATDRRLIAELAARGGAIRDLPGDPRLAVARPLPKPKDEGDDD